MQSFTAETTGRVHLIHLTAGDDVLKSITSEMKRIGIQSGIVSSGIGSLRKMTCHYIGATTEKPQDIFETVEKPLELACLQGIILEGEPHLHAVITEGGHKCYGGHLEEGCEVQYLAEISVIEVKELPLGRRSGQFGTVTHFEWLK